MPSSVEAQVAVTAGDVGGRFSVYDKAGALVEEAGERIVRVATGFDMTATTPWRRLLPTVIFLGFNKPVTSRLYVTSNRIVLLREIDSWRQVIGDMTPLGIPNAIATKVELDALRAKGVRQYCQLRPDALRLVRTRKSAKPGAWLGLRLVDHGDVRYAVSLWKTDGEDPETLSLIESRFRS
ncbi:MAG TPA: hypothetical protein HA326_09275 [Thermoplasmata archaeon]|nr:hypothetical protein [Thermoplasmata archaeon]